jgi:hypothetical protein
MGGAYNRGDDGRRRSGAADARSAEADRGFAQRHAVLDLPRRRDRDGEQIAAELAIGSDGNVEDVLQGEARPWAPTREQAQRMADSATFVIAFVWFVATLAGTEIPEIMQRGIETLLAFAVVMTRYARR